MGGTIKKEIRCDLLICGAGLAGLSLVYRALKAGLWQQQTIIIVTPTAQRENDKTWSFWKKDAGVFDELISKSWNQLSVFCNAGEQIQLNTGDYSYNTIRSIDFYEHVLSYLHTQENVQFFYEQVLSLDTNAFSCIAKTDYHFIRSVYAFNSIFELPKLREGQQYFLQHFKGVIIEVNALNMHVDEAYLMDYRTGQEHGTTFFYTLPLSSTSLFVEYTLFSKVLLEQDLYDLAIENYIKDVLKIKSYNITHTEVGVIPMTDHHFQRTRGNIINIGTIGGDTRGATGYTFINIQKTISEILHVWEISNSPIPIKESISAKHKLYDSILLNVLDRREYAGHELFCDLFKNTDACKIFEFLDAESSLLKDLRIILSLRPLPFVKAVKNALYSRFF